MRKLIKVPTVCRTLVKINDSETLLSELKSDFMKDTSLGTTTGKSMNNLSNRRKTYTESIKSGNTAEFHKTENDNRIARMTEKMKKVDEKVDELLNQLNETEKDVNDTMRQGTGTAGY